MDGGAGFPPHTANTMKISDNKLCIQIDRESISQNDSRWAGMQEYLAALK